MPEDMNRHRLNRAADMRAAWARYERLDSLGGEDVHLADMLADLMHWCAANGQDFDAAAETARRHFEAERADPTGEAGGPISEAAPVRMVCGHCGGDNVTRDAVAEWTGREWILRAVLDNSDCDDCCGETRIIEIMPTPTAA